MTNSDGTRMSKYAAAAARDERLSSFIKTVSRESIMKDNRIPNLNSILYSRRLTLRSVDLNEMMYK